MARCTWGTNEKLGEIPSISIIPEVDCPKGVPCIRSCYARRIFRRSPEARNLWTENSVHARDDIEGYMNDVNYLVWKRKPRLFRWHVGGDILNQEYLSGMEWVAGSNKNTIFLAFTKMHHLDYSRIQANLVIILSMWPGIDMPDVDLRKAWYQDGKEKRIPDDAIECHGLCESCGMCWQLPKIGRDVVFHKH